VTEPLPLPTPQEDRKDPLAIGLGALATGAGLGGAVVTLAQIFVEQLQTRLEPGDYQKVAGDPLMAGLFAGIAVAALFAWRRSTPLENVWQSGVIGVLAAVGALLVGFLAALVDRLLGLPGMIGWGLLSVALGVAGSRWAVQRAAGPGKRETRGEA
jgi:hypothetical protein